MTRKEEMPKKNREEREKQPKDLPFNPDITPEDKETLNNQSYDEQKGDYFKDREEPVDYAGADLDVPEMDEQQFNETRSEADQSEKDKRPKDSANSNDNIASQTETVYKGDKAKKYKDPSEKTRPEDKK